MNKHVLAITLGIVALVASTFGQNNINITGNIVTSGNGAFIYASQGSVQARDFVGTAGYMNAGTSVNAGTWLAAGGAGYIGDFLRVGGNTNVPAAKSVQIGQFATNGSFNALVVGRYNLNTAKDGTTAPTATSWVANDPLFVVANGTGNVADAPGVRNRNAFAVYKDGTITMSKAQGDVLMGQFGN